MILTMNLSTYTEIHTVLSILALAAGVVAVVGMLRSQRRPLWSMLYFVTAIATSATGFGFPNKTFTPAEVVGVISLVMLGIAVLARYFYMFAGAMRWLYAIGMTLSLYFLFFVLVAQVFSKLPALKALAPTQSEPPFAVAQGVLLLVFVAIVIAAVRKFHPKIGYSALRG